jgi:hypothetical protein
MKKVISFFFLIIICSFHLLAQKDNFLNIENLKFKGQLSAWGHLNTENPYPLYLGTRYIPQLNYNIPLKNNRLIDFEASANIYGSSGIHFFDSASLDGNINPYRIWARYSTKQFEIRGGLQKINFGSANMLRALRWFDQVDPRDPLQLTNGVWGGLARYYFLNNANLWLWVLYGNNDKKGLEFIETNANIPEFGGRFQSPVPKGELAISFHHRSADSKGLFTNKPNMDKIPENRIGIDGKWDLLVGLWFEGAWVHKSKNIGDFTNQEILTLGTDYTFALGSGLNMVFEHMLIASDEKAFQFSQTTNLSALSSTYTFGMFDNINVIVYYDWMNKSIYNFVNWYRQFDRTTFYVMGYWNPENSKLPTLGAAENLYGGLGFQLMFVFYH